MENYPLIAPCKTDKARSMLAHQTIAFVPCEELKKEFWRGNTVDHFLDCDPWLLNVLHYIDLILVGLLSLATEITTVLTASGVCFVCSLSEDENLAVKQRTVRSDPTLKNCSFPF